MSIFASRINVLGVKERVFGRNMDMMLSSISLDYQNLTNSLQGVQKNVEIQPISGIKFCHFLHSIINVPMPK